MDRFFYETRIARIDCETTTSTDTPIGLEMSREDWELITEALEYADFARNPLGYRARQKATALAKHIRSEILANLPEEETV